MVASFEDLKNTRKEQEEILIAELNKTNSSADDDGRFWQPTMDPKTDTASAVIRFLPPPINEKIPHVMLYTHRFKGPKGWYIENCLSTIKKPDPVLEYNSSLWATKSDALIKQARTQKRKVVYISNILVIKDKEKPENEGKVFLYKYGEKIFEKIQAQLKPAFDDEAPVNVFDPWSGANFKMTVVMNGEFRNYDNCSFANPSKLGTDEQIKNIWTQEYPLAPFMAPDQFKDYDTLKKRLEYVLDLNGGNVAKAVHKGLSEQMFDDEIPSFGLDDENDDMINKIKSLVEED